MIKKCYLLEPFTCMQDETLAVAAKKMQDNHHRQIYVVDSENKPVGILSITDIMQKVVIAEKNVAEFTVKDAMCKDILTYDDDTAVKVAYKAMVDKSVVTCVVTENEKMVGVLTLKEALKHITNPENVN